MENIELKNDYKNIDINFYNEGKIEIQVENDFIYGNEIEYNGNTYLYSEYDDAYILEDNRIYTEDEGPLHQDNDYYYCEDTGNCFINDDGLYYSQSDNCYYQREDDLIYISEGLEGNNEGYYNEEDGYYCEECDTYHHNDFVCDNGILASHGSSSHSDFSNGSEWKIGIEVEKSEMPRAGDIEEIKSFGWSAEEDGTVNGGEYISPILDLYNAYEFIEKTGGTIIEGYDVDNNCGGHIHLSNTNISKEELYKQVEYYRPILWGLYPTRILNYYCDRERDINNRYRDVAIRENTIEFRIFSGVYSLSQIKFRLELIKFFIENPCYSKEEAIDILNKKQKEFFDILDIAYKDLQKKIIALTRIYKFYELDIDNYKKTCKKIYKVLSEK